MRETRLSGTMTRTGFGDLVVGEVEASYFLSSNVDLLFSKRLPLAANAPGNEDAW